MKADDDEGADSSDSSEDEGLLSRGGLKAGAWRRKWLRRCSLGLAIYGAIVMVTCLVTNTLFVVAAH